MSWNRTLLRMAAFDSQTTAEFSILIASDESRFRA